MDAVRREIEAQRRRVWGAFEAEVRRAEADRDDMLQRLKGAVIALDGPAPRFAEEGSAEGSAPPQPKRQRRRRGGRSRVEVRKRREGVFRELVERDAAVGPIQVSRALNVSIGMARNDLKRLCEEGKAVRVGSGADTAYEAKAKRSAAGPTLPASDSSRLGTPEGRVLGAIQDRDGVSPDDVSQTTGISLEGVRRICGGLIAEEEIYIDRRDGRMMYFSRADA